MEREKRERELARRYSRWQIAGFPSDTPKDKIMAGLRVVMLCLVGGALVAGQVLVNHGCDNSTCTASDFGSLSLFSVGSFFVWPELYLFLLLTTAPESLSDVVTSLGG